MFKGFWRILNIILAGEDPEDEIEKTKDVELQLENQKSKLLDLQNKIYKVIISTKQKLKELETKIKEEDISTNFEKQYKFEIEFCHSQLERLQAKRELLQQDILEIERWRRQYEISNIEQDIYDSQNELLNLEMNFLKD